jgi:hypothetical protein
MPIRPIDMKAIMPNVQNHRESSQNLVNKDSINLQSTTQKELKNNDIKLKKTNKLEKKEDMKVDNDKEKDSKKRRRQKEKQKDQNDDKVHHIDILV